MNKILYFGLLLCLLTFSLIAQEKPSSQSDTVITNEGNDWESVGKDWDKEARRWDRDYKNWENDIFMFSESPTISLEYGIGNKLGINKFGTPPAQSFNGNFNVPNQMGVKLGFSSYKIKDIYLVKTKFNYFEVASFSTNLSNNKDANKMTSDLWKFGFGRKSGLGYAITQGTGIVFSNASSINWSKIKITSPVNIGDADYIDYFNDAFRFGTSAEGSIEIKLIPQMSINGGYERSAIFPRHQFWYWAGSAIIEEAALSLVDSFIEKIQMSSPAVAPIANFLLKSGIQYGLYELRKDRMNWPFKTARPLMYDQFKIGISFAL